jgi:glyoxylase-like metal-dependent hydrolase (beta-lactamase superfamily II)
VVSGDPAPGEAERQPLTHALFVFEWADGRQLLVDAGLAPGEAADFGGPLEWLGAGPMRCNPPAWDLPEPAPGPGAPPAAARAIVFTHLHVDHTSGVRELCRGGQAAVVRLSPEQEATTERYERQGLAGLAEAERDGCVRRDAWRTAGAAGPVEALADFPGAYRVAVPGHTPGSQLVVGFVAAPGGPVRGVVVAGDVVNHRNGFERDLPKPWWYRWLVVREDEDAQARNRALLRALAAAGFEILVSHHLPGAADGLAPVPCGPEDPSQR